MGSLVDRYENRGDLLHVEREVDPRFELAAVTDAVQKRLNKPLKFSRVGGTEFGVVTNLYGSRERIAEVVGIGPEDFCKRWSEVLGGSRWSEPVTRSAEAEKVVSGRLSALPLITYCERDAAPYFTSAIFLGEEPDTKVRNLSFHRSMYVSDEELRVRLAPRHHLTMYQEKAEQRGQPLEAALLIGVPPALFLAAAAPVPYETDELEVAARLSGRPIPMRAGRRIGMEVPVEAEIVVEGRFLPNVRRPEGPFGEFMGYYTGGNNTVFEVLDVSWRPNALFHSILCGSPEEVLTLEVAVAANIYQRVSAVLPGIRDVTCIPFVNHAVVKIDQQYEGHARQVLLAAFGAEPTWCKFCTVVDSDVDIYNLTDIMWAILTRPRPDKGIMVLESIPSFYKDPHKDHWGRVGIDATAPFERREDYERKRIPGAESIDLAEYLGTRPSEVEA
ncbi:MAG TPA: UbiD family decarboxylase [Candidatus Dormibacteraeota bacterium]|nr:UbiD family decarboxylase [Candidatus Dormibacteraeota bacterium]